MRNKGDFAVQNNWELAIEENKTYPDTWVVCDLEIIHNPTGLITRLKEPQILEEGEAFPDPFNWVNGNFSCDCNRGRLAGHGDTPCSKGLYSVQLSKPATGEVFYSDMPQTNFKFCGLDATTRFQMKAGELLSIDASEAEEMVPKSLWREGCYYFRRWPRRFAEWRNQGAFKYIDRSTFRYARLVQIDGEWFADMPYTESIDWDLHVDQGEKYWAAIAVLPQSSIRLKVRREFDYWREHRSGEQIRREVRLSVKKCLTNRHLLSAPKFPA